MHGGVNVSMQHYLPLFLSCICLTTGMKWYIGVIFFSTWVLNSEPGMFSAGSLLLSISSIVVALFRFVIVLWLMILTIFSCTFGHECNHLWRNVCSVQPVSIWIVCLVIVPVWVLYMICISSWPCVQIYQYFLHPFRLSFLFSPSHSFNQDNS